VPAQSAPSGIVPIPKYEGPWTRRSLLTGGWGGRRERWAEKGLTFHAEWFQAFQSVVSGGLSRRGAYSTGLDLYAELDLTRLNLLPGAVLSLRTQSRAGDTVNGDSGLLLPVNTFSSFPLTSPPDEDIPITITEFNYTQFFSESLAVVLGKITTMKGMNEFAAGEGRSQFMNFQFNYPAVMAQMSPYSTLAASVLWMPKSTVSVSSTVMNLADASTTTGFNDFDKGTTWMTAASTSYRLGELPGGILGTFALAFNGDFARIGGLHLPPDGGISVQKESQTWAVFVSGWQYIHLDEPAREIDLADGRQDLRGLGVFWILGFGERDTNPVPWSVALGLGGRGTIPARPRDTWGLGYFYNDVQDLPVNAPPSGRLGSSAQGVEFYYNAALAESIALTFGVQWTKSALRSADDNALTLGLRLNIRF